MNEQPSLDRALAGDRKGEYVAGMFGRIADNYDVMNRVMSLGQDQTWRRRMAEPVGRPCHQPDLFRGRQPVTRPRRLGAPWRQSLHGLARLARSRHG